MTFGPFGVGRDGRQGRDGARRGGGRSARSRDCFRAARLQCCEDSRSRTARAPSGGQRRVHICRDVADATGSISTMRAQVRFKGEVVARELAHALGIEIDPERTGRASAGRVWLSLEHPAQGRRQRRAWILRGRQQRDCRDRFVHGRRGGYADAGASGAIARQARRGDRGRARRRARGAGRASEEAADAKRTSGARATCSKRTARLRESCCARARSRATVGDATITIELEDGLSIEVDADLFSQVNHAQNRKLVATVMEMAAIRARDRDVLDLFCGAGNFSLPAARRGRDVTGVDADAARDRGGGAQCGAAEISRRRSFVAMKASSDRRFSASRALSARGRDPRSAAHRRARADGRRSSSCIARASSMSRATSRRWRAICAC